MQTVIYILPELFLSLSIMMLLMLGVFIKKSFKLVSSLTNIILIFTILLIINQPDELIKIFKNSYIIDNLSFFMKILTLLFCLFILISSKDYVKINNTNQIKVELKKLDNYINDDNFKNIDFIKIDTEGHESKVIEGGINFINKHRVKLIQIEFNWHHLFTHNTIFQFSEMLKNYVPVQMNLINGKLSVVDSNNYFSNIYHLSQFVFIEKDFFKEHGDKLLS